MPVGCAITLMGWDAAAVRMRTARSSAVRWALSAYSRSVWGCGGSRHTSMPPSMATSLAPITDGRWAGAPTLVLLAFFGFGGLFVLGLPGFLAWLLILTA